MVGGNPARVLKTRFDKETTTMLQGVRWWDWPDNVVRERLALLCSGDFEALQAIWRGQKRREREAKLKASYHNLKGKLRPVLGGTAVWRAGKNVKNALKRRAQTRKIG